MISGNKVDHNLIYEVCFIPVSKQLVNETFTKKLKQVFQECADLNRWQVYDVAIAVDHVRCRVKLSPTISLEKAMVRLKMQSNNLFKKELSEAEVKELFGITGLWKEGYFIGSSEQVKRPLCSGKDCLKNLGLEGD